MEKNYLEQAISDGINLISKNQPRFSNWQEYFFKHIDRGKVNDSVIKLKRRGLDENVIYKNIITYVSSGKAFDRECNFRFSVSSREGNGVKYIFKNI
jgi:hypothetical protein